MSITPIEMNMTITRNIYESDSTNLFIQRAQRIATYSLIPLALVAFFEAVVKNLIAINLANFCICAYNAYQSTYHPPAPEPQPPQALTASEEHIDSDVDEYQLPPQNPSVEKKNPLVTQDICKAMLPYLAVFSSALFAAAIAAMKWEQSTFI